jgi:hypothetical protein
MSHLATCSTDSDYDEERLKAFPPLAGHSPEFWVIVRLCTHILKGEDRGARLRTESAGLKRW